MSEVTMSMTVFKTVAANLPPQTSILLRARHGVGKSGSARQLRLLLKKRYGDLLGEFPLIDRRAGQMTEGDCVGLPSTDGEVTRFNPPEWIHRACRQPCFIFLDELNRGTPEVMQAFFQLALDHEMNGNKLHPETRVVSAINNSADYIVNEMDPALLDRFYTVDLEPTVEEFIEWARNEDPEQGGNLPSVIPDFIQGASNWLYPGKNHSAGSVEPTPRAWEMVARALVHAGLVEKPESSEFYHVCRGFVGNEAAIAFRDFAKSVDNRITGEDILERYGDPNVRAKVKRMGQERQNGAIEKLADHVLKTVTALSNEQGKNVAAFMRDLPDELKISLWSSLTKQGIDKMDLARSLHSHCAEIVLGVFGVPMGEAGIGVTPNIPGILKPKEEKKGV